MTSFPGDTKEETGLGGDSGIAGCALSQGMPYDLQSSSSSLKGFSSD
jgi:hypothetical protein